MDIEAHILSVQTGRAFDAGWAGRMKRTAIDKTPREGGARAGPLGLDGDEQADTEHHGGRDKAVYAYAREDLDLWESRLGRTLGNGSFGENLTTIGIDLLTSVVGERWRVGPVLLEAALPRTPCGVFQGWLQERQWVRRFIEEGRTGVYLRVLEQGHIAPGAPVTVEHRPDHGITVLAGFRAGRVGDLDTLRRLAELPGAPEEWGVWAERAATRAQNLSGSSKTPGRT
ncbi:MOSC domain-containing protein [Nocardiopsis kunsanensis]|uniref:Sulfurase n=1 Tax=Nocardiopsis kunsanensis TaxID=141693 RepID=A0A918X6G9_9ACTN|nr:MOSC domain-containing protein [Nocardiopsis kunsanensis]GHD14560.1 sulfurase [Nocardiopsis kunsanensis]